MFDLLVPLAQINLLWYSVPLIISISLVYSATRHEEMGPILSHAARLAVMIAVFMAVILVVLALLSWWL